MEYPSLLIVEDDPVSAKVLQGLLQRQGREVIGVARDASEALELLEHHRVELVLMDIALPGGMDGVELAQVIQECHDTAVIYLTAHADMGTFTRATKTNPMGYLTKPVHDGDLQRVVTMALRHLGLERALRNSEERYRLIFENAAAGIYTATCEGELRSANAALAAILGYESATEMLTYVRQLDMQYYFDTPRAEELRRRLEAEGEVRRFESQVMGRDGDVFWVEEHVRLVREKTGHCFRLALVLDVTARKAAQDAMHLSNEMLRRTIDAIPDKVCLLDLEGNVILANKALAEHQGRPQGELAGRPYQELVFPGGRVPHGDPFRQAAARGESVTNILCTDEQGHGYFISAAPFHGPGGAQIGVVHVTRDLDAVKLL